MLSMKLKLKKRHMKHLPVLISLIFAVLILILPVNIYGKQDQAPGQTVKKNQIVIGTVEEVSASAILVKDKKAGKYIQAEIKSLKEFIGLEDRVIQKEAENKIFELDFCSKKEHKSSRLV